MRNLRRLKNNIYLKKVYEYLNNQYKYFKTTIYYKNIIYYLREAQVYISPEYLKNRFNLENYKRWKRYEKFRLAKQQGTVNEELIKQTFLTDEEYLNYTNDIYFFDTAGKLDNYLVKFRVLILKTVDNGKLFGNKKYINKLNYLYKNYYIEYKKFTKIKPPKGHGIEYRIGFLNTHGNGVKACELILEFINELNEEVYTKGIEYFIKALDSRKDAHDIFRLIYMYGNNWSKHTNKTLLPEIIDM